MTAPITEWLAAARVGDNSSLELLWHHYFERLVMLASQRLPLRMQAVYDGEDAALSALHSFFAGAMSGRFGQCRRREDLWGMLALITTRKVLQRRRYANRLKRNQAGDSALSVSLDGCARSDDRLEDHRTVPPDLAAEAAEECVRLIQQLPEDSLRYIVHLRLNGYTNREIAAELKCAECTVERKMNRIRACWYEHQGAAC